MLSSSPYGGACLKISFWKDKWIGKGALEELFPSIHTLCLQQEAIVGKYGQTMAGISFKFYLYEKKNQWLESQFQKVTQWLGDCKTKIILKHNGAIQRSNFRYTC